MVATLVVAGAAPARAAAPATAALAPAAVLRLDGVACPTQTTCYAVGSTTAFLGVILETDNGGHTWWRRHVPATSGQLFGIACPSAQNCVAVGIDSGDTGAELLRTDDGGAIWTTATPPVDSYGETIGALMGVRCSTALRCEASGWVGGGLAAIAATTDGGTTWTAQALNFGAVQNGVSCPRPNECFVVGSDFSGSDFVAVIGATTDGGSTWTRKFAYPASAAGSGMGWQFNSISCPSPTDCVTVGGSSPGPGGADIDIFATADAGTTWVRHPVPDGVVGLPYEGLAGVACPRPADCYAVGGPDIIDTTNSGWVWHQQSVPADATALAAIACPVYFRCYAVGGTTVLATTDSGQHWTSQPIS